MDEKKQIQLSDLGEYLLNSNAKLVAQLLGNDIDYLTVSKRHFDAIDYINRTVITKELEASLLRAIASIEIARQELEMVIRLTDNNNNPFFNK